MLVYSLFLLQLYLLEFDIIDTCIYIIEELTAIILHIILHNKVRSFSYVNIKHQHVLVIAKLLVLFVMG